jgi:hypothetical protein
MERTPVAILASARGWLHAQMYTTGGLDAIVLLFQVEKALIFEGKIEQEGL